eukprot:Tamp_24015.p1 GENE.Tamp_24015~~Tamp_24015.p1  ORF type:complete len:289 (+),score=86.74 Tamp_24015:116-868(+)
MLPVTIKQIIAAQQEGEEGCKVDGREANQVTFVGQIVNVKDSSVTQAYEVEDSTGRVEVLMWIDNDESEEQVQKRSQWVPGAYVRVVGSVRPKQNEPNVKSVNAFHIRKVEDFNEITYHLLDSVHAHLYNTQGPKDSLPPAGSSNFASPGKPSVGPGQGPAGGAAAGAGAAVAAFSAPGGAGGSLQDMVVKAFEELMGGDSGVAVADITGYCCKNMGRDIPKSAVMKIVEQMCIDGMCYSTIDEEHYSKI